MTTGINTQQLFIEYELSAACVHTISRDSARLNTNPKGIIYISSAYTKSTLLHLNSLEINEYYNDKRSFFSTLLRVETEVAK